MVASWSQSEYLHYFIEWLHVWFTFDSSISLTQRLDLEQINKILQNSEIFSWSVSTEKLM